MWRIWLLVAVSIGLILTGGVRVIRGGGPVYREIVAVKPGEMVTVQLQVSKSVYVFGWRVMVLSEGREIVGVTLRDYQSGKLIGRYHDIGVKICPECKGTGEEADYHE